MAVREGPRCPGCGLHTAQKVFADQLPFVPLVTPMNLWAHHKRVHNWLPTQPNLYPFYQDVYIDKKS